ncbi:MAG: hypothetical protein ACYCQI_15315 [Gammaproteobacteria bacterium]
MTKTFLARRSKQSAQANLFLGAINNLVFVIPPISEQRRIVAKIDELMTWCDQLKACIIKKSQIQSKLATLMVEKVMAL